MSIRDLIPSVRSFPMQIRQSGVESSLAAMQDEMNRMFNHFFGDVQMRLTDWDAKLPRTPAVDVSEKAKEFIIKAEIAGKSPEEVEVEVTDGYLTLRGEKKNETKDEKENFLRQEISYGSFYRTIALPEAADCRKADATFKSGVMTITVPKKEAALAEPQKLKIKSAA